tara:strand:- start:43 stop:405 length:363 start_codon:yes stop_codon:yes gene_type:complete
MGDRINIELRFGYLDPLRCKPNSIHIYGHWAGSHVIEGNLLRFAIDSARTRWDDPTYCARIIMSRLMAASHNDTTGWGISPDYTDSENPAVVVDLENHTVSVGENRYSFGEYCEGVLISE